MFLISNSVSQTQTIAKRLAKLLKPGDVFALIGNLGSGKTVFVKGLAEGLGCRKKDVISPTFVLLRQYKGQMALNHFDLYRLKNMRQLIDIGYEEYFYSDGVAVIEWADRIESALPKEHIRIEFTIRNDNKRLIKITSKSKGFDKNADNLRQFKRQAVKVS